MLNDISIKGLILPLLDYFRILRRRVWMMLVIFVAAVGLTAWNTYRQKPVYQAGCLIRYKRSSPTSLLTGGALPYYLNPYFDNVSFETEKHVITSKLIAEGVVRTLGLADPENLAEWNSWIRRVQSAISVDRVKETRIYKIASRSSDPELAQALANTTAEVYINSSLQERQESAEKVFSMLSGQIDGLRSKIEQSEMAKIDYVQRTQTVPASVEDGDEEQSVSFGVSHSASLLEELRATLVRQEIRRQELLSNYLEKHPRVQEIDRQIEVLREKIAAENEQLIQAHRAAIEYGILEKEAAADQDQYQILIRKLKDLNISDSGIESGIEIIERAERPRSPIAPRRGRNLALSALFGLFLGLGAVFLIEYFDSSLQTPEEVEDYTKLSVLATIPRMDQLIGEKDPSQYPFLISRKDPAGHEAEMFKHLRTSIRVSHPETENLSLLVTSSGPREGKSVISANLSISTAEAGLETVLIDADLRRPVLHKVFGIENRIGLSSYLADESSREEIIIPTSITGLSLIPSGPVPHNPSELLESPRLAALVDFLKESRPRVIFDSPPAGSMTDAAIIAGRVDGVILVIFAGRWNRKFILQTKGQLEKTGVKIFGAVLNYISLKMRSYYYFYQGVYKYAHHA
jgi:polysaccharide biosynthesis transport protein